MVRLVSSAMELSGRVAVTVSALVAGLGVAGVWAFFVYGDPANLAVGVIVLVLAVWSIHTSLNKLQHERAAGTAPPLLPSDPPQRGLVIALVISMLIAGVAGEGFASFFTTREPAFLVVAVLTWVLAMASVVVLARLLRQERTSSHGLSDGESVFGRRAALSLSWSGRGDDPEPGPGQVV